MKVAVISSVRLFRECIAANLERLVPPLEVITGAGIAGLVVCPPGEQPDVAVVDVTLGVDLEEVGLVAVKWPDMPLLALGLREQLDEVVAHGRAGFVSYIPRDASVSELRKSIVDAVAGRLQCSAEITAGLMRALCRHDQPQLPPIDKKLTQRETEILYMLGRNLSNKEIARELSLSVATIKSHVHNVLGKLGVAQRGDAMRRIRASPWVGQYVASGFYEIDQTVVPPGVKSPSRSADRPPCRDRAAHRE